MDDKLKKHLDNIRKSCSDVVGVDIRKKKRTRKTYVYGRYCFYKLVMLTTNLKEPQIAEYLGIDRVSVIHAKNKFDNLISYNDFVLVFNKCSKKAGFDYKYELSGGKIEIAKSDVLELHNENIKLRKENRLLKDKNYKSALKELNTLLKDLSEEGIQEAKERLEPFVKMWKSRKTYDNTTREQRG